MKKHITIGLAWSALMLAAMAGIIVYTSGLLPEDSRIPLHFGPDGRPDRFGSRDEAVAMLWLMPGITAVVTAIMAVAPFLDPRRENVAIGRRAYLASWMGIMALMVLVTAGVSFSMVRGQNPAFDTSGAIRWILAGCAVLLIILGNYLPKTRSSFVFGVRTPWTLSSDMAWEKTHRLAGPLFMLAGCLGLIGAFVFNGIALALQLTVLVLTVVLICVVYSYLVWRKAEDRDTGSRHVV